MGGLGRHCSQRRRARSSCLAEGRIDVYYGKKKGGTPSCSYQAGLTSGVVCCKIVSEIRPKGEILSINLISYFGELNIYSIVKGPFCDLFYDEDRLNNNSDEEFCMIYQMDL